MAAAIGGALAGCHPSGTPFLDPVYAALFAAAVTWAAARASRAALLWLGVLTVVMSRGWLLVPALAALLLAFAGVWPRRPNAILGALTGSLAVQVVLRWPTIGFMGQRHWLPWWRPDRAWWELCAPCRRRHDVGCAASPSGWWWWSLSSPSLSPWPPCWLAPSSHGGLPDARRTGVDREWHDHIGRGAASGGDNDFASAASRTNSWWTAGARLIPVVAQQRQALGQASAVASDVTATAAEQASGINYQQLRYSDGHWTSACSTPSPGRSTSSATS